MDWEGIISHCNLLLNKIPFGPLILPLLQLILKYWNYNLNINLKSLIQFKPQENNKNYSFEQLPLESLIALVLMTTHMLRRTLESFFVTKFSDAKMHFGHYLVGITFYIFTSFSIIIESINNDKASLRPDVSPGDKHIKAVYQLPCRRVTAYGVHNWYIEKFKEDYPKNRKRMIPFIF
ncbi:hypothetical protein PIROE2DRAFT_11886 [Piromyces sp. E2]|nr:hypothetical protein PIROE2DRAFT_11886 [Piromyces sp. E2]|eukprot:OUM61961.1 hypothetical protein PIROE2DRAFT_11886 [Piromyces sp. E2]